VCNNGVQLKQGAKSCTGHGFSSNSFLYVGDIMKLNDFLLNIIDFYLTLINVGCLLDGDKNVV